MREFKKSAGRRGEKDINEQELPENGRLWTTDDLSKEALCNDLQTVKEYEDEIGIGSCFLLVSF